MRDRQLKQPRVTVNLSEIEKNKLNAMIADGHKSAADIVRQALHDFFNKNGY